MPAGPVTSKLHQSRALSSTRCHLRLKSGSSAPFLRNLVLWRRRNLCFDSLDRESGFFRGGFCEQKLLEKVRASRAEVAAVLDFGGEVEWRSSSRNFICFIRVSSSRRRRILNQLVGFPRGCWPSMAWRNSQILFQRVFSSKSLPKSPAFTRRVTTLNSPPATTQDTLDALPQTKNGEAIFAGFSSRELGRTLLNLHLVAYEPLVDFSLEVLTSPLMRYALLNVPVNQVVKWTAYSHFCAGENVEEASRTLQRMWELGLRGILDYGSEDATDNKSCDKNLENFVQVVQQTSLLPLGSVSSACVKISATCPIQLLERVSNLLRWQHAHKEFKLPWKQDVIPFLADDSPTYHVTSTPEPLTEEEESDLALAHDRLSELCKACEQESLPLLIDAEYSSIQPAIDYIIHVAAAEFNKGARPIVYGTFQAYLKDSFSRLKLAVNASQNRGLSYCVKLVRGAYISREKELASALRVPSPVHSNIEGTHRCYDLCASFMLEQAANGDGAVLLATHNMDSGQKAAAKAQELGLSREDPRLQFAQLKGMADVLSLSLAQAGFRVSKYLPFGPVHEVIPYLVRRAEENRGLLGNTAHECQAIRTELRRRLLQG